MGNERNVKPKKPFVNRWWFWIVVLFIAGATAASGGHKDYASKTESSNEQNTELASTNNNDAETENEGALDSVETAEPEATRYDAGVYVIGTDLPAGDFYIESQNGHSHFAISSDSTGEPESIVANEDFSTHTLVTVSEGQYLEVKNAIIIPLEEAPALVNGTEIGDGVYRVGTDFPAGEYKITLTGYNGHYKVSTDMTHTSDSIVTNNIVEEDKYLTVYDGQILKLNGITLILE